MSHRNSVETRRGDTFEHWVLPHRQMLAAQARRLTGNASDAEDLVQETLLRAFSRRDMLAGKETAGAWLATIQRNLFINEYRRRRSGPVLVPLFEQDGAGEARVDSAEAQATRRLEFRATINALTALPSLYREPLYLSDVEGHSYQEIADATGAPIGTVRSRIARGRRRLWRTLASWRGNINDAYRAV